MKRPITPVQQRCWDALHEHRSVKAAADALGMTTWAVRSACQAYMVNMGMEGPLPFTKVYARKDESLLVRQLRERIAELEELLASEREDREREIVRLTQRMADLAEQAQPWAAVHQKLDRILARPVGAIVPTHRRRADGGVGGKREARPRPMAITA